MRLPRFCCVAKLAGCFEASSHGLAAMDEMGDQADWPLILIWLGQLVVSGE